MSFLYTENTMHMFLLLFELSLFRAAAHHQKEVQSPHMDGQSLPGNVKSSCLSGQRCSDKSAPNGPHKAVHGTSVRKLPHCPTMWPRAVTFLHAADEGSNTAHFAGVQKFQGKPKLTRRFSPSPPAPLWNILTAVFVLFNFPNQPPASFIEVRMMLSLINNKLVETYREKADLIFTSSQ